MEALKLGEMRVHLKGGTSYVCPEINKNNVIGSLGDTIERLELFKSTPQPLPPLPPAKTAAPVANTSEKTKETLLKGKTKASDIIAFIEGSSDLGDLGIVMKDETRKTVTNAYKARIEELT